MVITLTKLPEFDYGIVSWRRCLLETSQDEAFRLRNDNRAIGPTCTHRSISTELPDPGCKYLFVWFNYPSGDSKNEAFS